MLTLECCNSTAAEPAPAPPNGIQAIAREGGRIQVQWVPANESLQGYHIYRSSASFTNAAAVPRLSATPFAGVSWLDLPPADGVYFYRVSSVNLAGTEGALSAEVSAASDRVPPQAEVVTYQPESRFDPVTGRFGRTAVEVLVQMSEPIQGIPFFSLTPSGGLPIGVELSPLAGTQYRGSFMIGESTPSGVAAAVLSARDLVGNRGSAILSGQSIRIDTAGPVVTNLVFQPAGPVRNDPGTDVTFTARLDEILPTNALPRFAYSLSASAAVPTPVLNVRPGQDPWTWVGSFALPPDAAKTPETLTLRFEAEDDLENPGTRIVPPHTLEVYQGNLPALEPPVGLTARPRPAGAIALEWSGVPDAVDYQIYRSGPGEPGSAPLARTAGALAWTDTPPRDGLYTYAVASVRRANGQETVSAVGNAAAARADRLAPPAPTGLNADLAGSGALLRWTAPAGLGEPVTYNVYRASRGPIADVAALTPLLRGIPGTQVVDPNPAPAEPYYAVVSVDDAGNLSEPSNTDYLNADLLPVGLFAISLDRPGVPLLSWSQAGTAVAGHKLFLGEDGAWVQLGGLLPNGVTNLIDTGYTGEDRRYTLVTVDFNGQESPGRSLRLPATHAQLAADAVVKRGLMNRLVYAVTNESAEPIENAWLEVALAGRSHRSAPFRVLPGTSAEVAVVVGGYSDLPTDRAPLATTLRIRPQEGESVALRQTGTVAVAEGQTVVNVLGSGLVRGGTASVQFSLLNTGLEELEVRTATAQGAAASPDVRFALLDADGHVLSSVPLRSALGAGTVNLANGDSVLRVPGVGPGPVAGAGHGAGPRVSPRRDRSALLPQRRGGPGRVARGAGPAGIRAGRHAVHRRGDRSRPGRVAGRRADPDRWPSVVSRGRPTGAGGPVGCAGRQWRLRAVGGRVHGHERPLSNELHRAPDRARGRVQRVGRASRSQ
jgi:hypothetical protein